MIKKNKMTKNYIESLENFSSNFEKTKDNQIYMREQIVEFKEENKMYINFKECHIAICPNGGLIAICKKKGYLDITMGSRINHYIIIMHQNAKKKYLIPIDWKYNQKYFILFDFNDKEQLYGICNDGSIFKIDILTERAVPKITCDILKTENIAQAKLFEEGFIALTALGNFYYIKDIKNPIPELFFQMKSQLHFSNNIEFLIIPSSFSKSKKIELLIANEKGQGVIHVERMEDGRYCIIPIDEKSQLFAYEGISIIKKDKLEPFYLDQDSIINKEILDKKIQESQYGHENLKKILAFAISPSKENIAMYDSRGVIFFFNSTLDLNLEKNPRIKVQIELDNNDSSSLTEQQLLINYGEGFQFLFCGEDSVILSGLTLIFLVHKSGSTFIFKINDEQNEKAILKGKHFFKCISEIDGIRYLTEDGIFFISQVCQELVNISDPFSNNISKKLIQAYQNYLDKSVNSEKSLREIGKNLSKAINFLVIAASNIFWVEYSPESQNYDKKEIQLFILKAAQYGKNFAQKDDINFDKFLEMCKDIRCVNNIRNHSDMPKLITFKEFKKFEPKNLIKILMRNLNFGMAFEICHYLDYSDKRVYHRYAVAKIKKASKIIYKDKAEEEKEEEKIFKYLNEKLKNVPNLSFIKLAKKAFKYHKNIIGMKFLENEKSALSKIPQYIELMQWDKALDFAENFNDSNVINTVIYKIFKKEKRDDFIIILSNHPKIKNNTIQFLKNNDFKQIEKFLKINQNPEELFFYYLEQYFQSPYIAEREKYISLAKQNLHLIDNNINFDHKFYKNYLESLENNLKFKYDSQKKDIITNPDEVSFDISIYDFYKIGIKEIKEEKNNCIDTYNKAFGFPQEGMNILKLTSYGENQRFVEIDSLIKKNNNIKKMGLTYLNMAEIFYKFEKYDKALEYIKSINEPIYIDYKIDMLEYTNNLKGALEVIISDKNISNMTELVNSIIKREPDLEKEANELYEKYKIKIK